MRVWTLAGALIVMSAACGVSRAQSESDHPPNDRAALHQACSADIQKFCAADEGGGHHVMQCVRQHQDALSDGCKSALSHARADHHWRPDSSSEGASPEGQGRDASPQTPTPQSGGQTTP